MLTDRGPPASIAPANRAAAMNAACYREAFGTWGQDHAHGVPDLVWLRMNATEAMAARPAGEDVVERMVPGVLLCSASGAVQPHW